MCPEGNLPKNLSYYPMEREIVFQLLYKIAPYGNSCLIASPITSALASYSKVFLGLLSLCNGFIVKEIHLYIRKLQRILLMYFWHGS